MSWARRAARAACGVTCKAAWAGWRLRWPERAATSASKFAAKSPVRHILTDRGRVAGVRLEDGTQIDAKVVASSVDAHLTFEKFLTPDELPE